MTLSETVRHHSVALSLCVIMVALLAATLMLWVHYGPAVFLEMIQAGFAACFG